MLKSMLYKGLIVCLLNFYTTYILTSTFYITECISGLIKVTEHQICFFQQTNLLT